jgi:hypothetical protein
MTAVSRTGGGKILIPFALDDETLTAEGATEVGPDDPRYAEWDAWLTAIEADTPAAWTVTGEIPDTGEQAEITWRDGIEQCPPDALDWLIAATEAGEVDASDGRGLLAWLRGQGFAVVVPESGGPA